MKHLSFLFLVFWLVSDLAPAVTIETHSFSTVVEKVTALGKKYGPKRVLIAWDNDNTLLAQNQDLGSDQWWVWQYDMLKGKQPRIGLVSDKFSGLLKAQGILFTVSSMSPPEKELSPKVVRKLHQQGFPMIVITARGHDFRHATVRELRRNYPVKEGSRESVFRHSGLKPRAGYASTFAPYNEEILKKLGVGPELAKKFRLRPNPTPVSYQDGVYMTAGGHKGVMLQSLLLKTKQLDRFKAVVFVDDKARYSQQIEQAFKLRKGVEVATFRYGKWDLNVKRFAKSDKKEAIQAWANISSAFLAALAEPNQVPIPAPAQKVTR